MDPTTMGEQQTYLNAIGALIDEEVDPKTDAYVHFSMRVQNLVRALHQKGIF